MFRKFFSLVFCFLFVPIFLVFLIALSLKFSLLNSDFLKNTFIKADLYNSILDDGASSLLKTVEKNAQFGLGPLNAEDISLILKSSISAGWLQNQTETAIDNYSSFAYGKTDKLEIILPLIDFKKSLSQNIEQNLINKLENLPNCTNEQLKQLQSEEGLKSINCKPAGTNTKEISESLTKDITGKGGLISQLPDNYNLTEKISANPAKTEALQRFYKIFNLIFKALLLASSIILAIIALINIKYFPGMLKWLCIPIMIPSLIILILGLTGKLLSVLLMTSYLTILPAEMKVAASALVNSVFGSIFNVFQFYGLIFLIASVLMLILAIVLSKKFPYQLKTKHAIGSKE